MHHTQQPQRLEPPPSVWELTAAATRFSDSAASPVVEVEYDGAIVPANDRLFASWTGHRLINGEYYHGPIYRLDDGSPFDGPRLCGCATCQSTVAPRWRHG